MPGPGQTPLGSPSARPQQTPPPTLAPRPRAHHATSVGLLAGPDELRVRLRPAMLAAVPGALLGQEAALLRLRAQDVGNLPVVFEYHVAAPVHTERAVEAPQVVVFGVRRMRERLEPAGVNEVRYGDA